MGGFEIIRMLGEGGMGEVYLARQLSLGRNVALKILPAQMKMRRGVAERFFKEVHLLAQLDHANIVMAFEAGEDAGVMYLAMGYVNGETLEQKLQRDGPMQEDEALQMTARLAGALDYAWREHKLMHRDIKPSNVMLTAGGELKLMDFGLAKCLEDQKGLTLSGTIMGTPNYMSPEQVEGLAELDFRADLYSLGATLYHMVTGKLPFAGSSVLETLRKQVNEVLPDPRTVNPAVTEHCVTLLELMLSKKREQRHADYQALIGDIERVRAGQPPRQERLKEGESILLRINALGRPQGSKAGAAGKAPVPSNRRMLAGIAAGAAIAVGVGTALVIGLRPPRADTAKSEGAPQAVSAETEKVASAPGAPVEKPPPDDAQSKMKRQYLEALAFVREHPEDFTGALAMLEPLGKAATGTELEGKVKDEIERAMRVRRKAVDRAITALKTEVAAQVAQGNFERALKRIELDTGLVTEETKAARAELAREVTAQKQAADELAARQAAETERQEQLGKANAKLAALARDVAEDLLKGNASALAARLSSARVDPGLGIVSNEMSELNAQALAAIVWPERVAKTFEEQKDRAVTVELKGGRKEQFTVTGVQGDWIKGQRQIAAGFIGREFSVNDLSAAEKIKRLGDDPRPAIRLMRGLVYVQGANDWASAGREFAAAGGLLGNALASKAPARPAPSVETAAAKPVEKAAETKVEQAAMDGPEGPDAGRPMARRLPTPRDRQARQFLAATLQMAGIPPVPANPRVTAEKIRRGKYSAATVTQIKDALAYFDKTYADTLVAQQFAIILDALRALAPEFVPVELNPATEETIKAAQAQMEKDNAK